MLMVVLQIRFDIVTLTSHKVSKYLIIYILVYILHYTTTINLIFVILTCREFLRSEEDFSPYDFQLDLIPFDEYYTFASDCY